MEKNALDIQKYARIISGGYTLEKPQGEKKMCKNNLKSEKFSLNKLNVGFNSGRKETPVSINESVEK